MITEWLEQYKPRNNLEGEQALREIMQEVALAGLQRSGFFELAAFYSGSALRIFHGLNRFSEDLDFSLLSVTPGDPTVLDIWSPVYFHDQVKRINIE